MKRLVFILASAVMANSLHAQHRCVINGKTVIQEQPCPGVRRSESLPLTYDPLLETANKAMGNTEAIEIGLLTCRRHAPKSQAWLDPDSVKVGKAMGGKMVTIGTARQKAPVRAFVVMVNAKNSFGGYTGEKPLFCYTTPDGQIFVRASESAMH